MRERSITPKSAAKAQDDFRAQFDGAGAEQNPNWTVEAHEAVADKLPQLPGPSRVETTDDDFANQQEDYFGARPIPYSDKVQV